MVEARKTAEKILKFLAEEFTGEEAQGEKLLEWIEDYLNTDHFEPDDYGNFGVLYRYLEVARLLVVEQFKAGENPTIYIVDSRLDYKDTMYVVFDPQKEAVLDYGWFKWESKPFESVGELLSYVAGRYEKMRKKVEELYGVSLQPFNPDEIARAGEEFYKELKEKYQEVEQA